jgi:catalase
VPTHDEQRVRYSHYNSITCNDPECPVNVRHVDGSSRHIRSHAGGNTRVPAAIPAPCFPAAPSAGRRGQYQPCRTQLSGDSDADSADG